MRNDFKTRLRKLENDPFHKPVGRVFEINLGDPEPPEYNPETDMLIVVETV